MEPLRLKQMATRVAQWINNTHPWQDIINEEIPKPPADRNPLLVYSGMSGVSIATAIQQELMNINANWVQCLPRPSKHVIACYVRKPDEKSHGLGRVEMRYPCKMSEIPQRYYPIFVDDFISSGDTFTRVRKILAEPGEFSVPFTWPGELWYGALESMITWGYEDTFETTRAGYCRWTSSFGWNRLEK